MPWPLNKIIKSGFVDKRGKKTKKGKDFVPPTEEEIKKAKAHKPTHQTYLDGPRGAKVLYSNCDCTEYTTDHSRGTTESKDR